MLTPAPPLVPGETAETKHLHQRDVQVDHADTAYGAAQVQIVPVLMPLGNEGGEVVRLPVFGPRKDEQEEADFKTEGDKQDRRHLVVPAGRRPVHGHGTGERLRLVGWL